MRKMQAALGIMAAGIAAAIAAATPALAAGSPWLADSHPQPRGADASGFGSVFTASRSQAWAVGFQAGTLTITPLIEHWNGTSWAITSGAPGTSNESLNAVGGTGPADVWAVGGDNGGLIEHFNGTSWKVFTSPAGPVPPLHAISADSPADAWAAGGIGQASVAPVVEHWNGTAWRPAKAPLVPCYICQITSIDALSPSDVWDVGTGFTGAGQTLSFLEHFDGSHWHLTLNPVAGASTAAIDGTSPTDVWAVYTSGTGAVIEHFNGTTWTKVPNPAAGNSDRLAAVAALSRTDAWAMSGNGALTEQWNGTAWHVVPNPNGLTLGEDSGGNFPGSPALSGIAGGPLFAVGSSSSGQSAILQQPRP
jgi:hypothetical protein